MDYFHMPEMQSGGNELASKVAYLIGVPRKMFSDPDETENRLNSRIFDMLDRDRNCQKFRFLCMMRNAMLRYYVEIRKGLQEFKALRDLLPEDTRNVLDKLAMEYGVQLYPSNKERGDVRAYIVRINRYLEQCVQNALNQFPKEHRKYLRSAFLMPSGTDKKQIDTIRYDFKDHMRNYPFQCYLNINLTIPKGLVLSSDSHFLSLLYEEHEDRYVDPSAPTTEPGEGAKALAATSASTGEAQEEERLPIPASPAVNPTQEQIEIFTRERNDAVIAADGASVTPEKLCSLLNAQTRPDSFAKVLIFAASDGRENWERTFPPEEGSATYYDLTLDSFSGALLYYCMWDWDRMSPMILVSDNTEQIRRFFQKCSESEIDCSSFLILTETVERQKELNSRDEEDDDGIRASGTLADYLSNRTLLRELAEERLTKAPLADLSVILREEAESLGAELMEAEYAKLLRDILSRLRCEFQPDGRIFLRLV